MIRNTLMISAAAATFLAGCEGVGPKTQNGALAGAAVGALAGVALGDDEESRRRGAVLGAAAGAAVGGAIGANLDKQARELDNNLDGRIKVVNTGDRLIVTMPQDILFATDSTALNATLQDDLYTLARSLNDYPNTTVQVVGHTDNTGSAAYNQDLSERRALAVRSVLLNGGVSSGRVQAFGRGESQPIASNQSTSGRAQNRRVEIVIIPNT
ncbi:MAG: OmpA family protein [Vannielia sp.]|uniref:OmpA family protein n=1 Tax=Rhodobacterales TaxID=204455 RepID=UPI002094B7EB|nr:OmpA family protein [Oceanicola sp. 502str15]MCO6383196.1 OmpA family protein [Oceanicola sp. 502str15]